MASDFKSFAYTVISTVNLINPDSKSFGRTFDISFSQTDINTIDTAHPFPIAFKFAVEHSDSDVFRSSYAYSITNSDSQSIDNSFKTTVYLADYNAIFKPFVKAIIESNIRTYILSDFRSFKVTVSNADFSSDYKTFIYTYNSTI